MTAVVAIAQRKGGSGKTTLAAHLGATWAASGHSVALIDTDPQASLTQWYRRRAERLGPGRVGLEFAGVTGWRAAGEVVRYARGHDIVLVDSPGSAEADVRTTIRAAGLVLVPVQPSPPDVWATLPTLEMAQQEGVPALLVLNRVPARAALTAAMRERLAAYDIGLASISIGNRVALAAAFAEGWGIGESAGGSIAANEIAALAAEVLELLPLEQPAVVQAEATVAAAPIDRVVSFLP
ncbi:MAG TPA: ParA family partition ATPase [Stellaceae bacterium]|nr:ParA family partition ATPase [Stellaceae bacterium]